MSNYAPGWYSWYLTCSTCGDRYHPSGVDECSCVRCEGCRAWVAPEDLDGDLCRDCANAADEAGDEAGHFDFARSAS